MATSPVTDPSGPFEPAALRQLREWDARWAEACARMATGPWRAEVLPRRLAALHPRFQTPAPAMAGLGLPIIGKLLGHSQPATTQRYAHLDADPLRRASDKIAGTIAAAFEGKAGGNVVKLNRKGKTR